MKKLYVEIADTSIKREYGLMDRKHLSKNNGMLFKFPYPHHLGFWMKNTYLPLDIAFIDDNGTIIQIEEMIPLSTRAISSKERCRYALEVNHGWFQNNDIREGCKVFGNGILDSSVKFSQSVMPLQVPEQSTTMMPNMMPLQPEQPGQFDPLPQPSPDVLLNRSFKEILQDANNKGKDLIIIYQTKGGVVLPPKSISPPFTFEKDAEGNVDAIVKVWDNQDAGWKSFLIDNILDLEEKEQEIIEEKMEI